MVQQLQDGNPLTVQWLNALAREVSDLTNRFSETTTERTIPAFAGGLSSAAKSDNLVFEGTATSRTLTSDMTQNDFEDFTVSYSSTYASTPIVFVQSNNTSPVFMTVKARDAKSVTIRGTNLSSTTIKKGAKIYFSYLVIGTLG